MDENIVLPSDLEYELIQMRNLIGLATFAAEARRVLVEIDLIAEEKPAIHNALGSAINARRQWVECPDTLAPALGDVYDRLGRLIGRD